ncbi:MAG: hypothetical protein KAU16_06975 [Methanophagales archaeon]|nr:hypothetical protein [Methanophagales archaeon]
MKARDRERDKKGLSSREAYVQILYLNFLCYRFKHLSMGYVAVHARRVEHGFN